MRTMQDWEMIHSNHSGSLWFEMKSAGTLLRSLIMVAPPLLFRNVQLSRGPT